MADIELQQLYDILKTVPKRKLLRLLIFGVIEKLLKEDSNLSDAQKHKLARLRSYIQINFTDF